MARSSRTFHAAAAFPDAVKWGTIALGGTIVTAGGLVFNAGTTDPAIYAFDVATGKQLWRGKPADQRAGDADDLSRSRWPPIRRRLRRWPWSRGWAATWRLRRGVCSAGCGAPVIKGSHRALVGIRLDGRHVLQPLAQFAFEAKHADQLAADQ